MNAIQRSLLGLGQYTAPSEYEMYGSNASSANFSDKEKGGSSGGNTDWLNKGLDLLNTGLNLFQNAKSGGSSGSIPPPPPPPSGVSTKTIVIGALALTAVGTAAYFAFSPKKKSLSGLGDLDTAKTKAGRKRQRAAVFAKLDEAGDAWPKIGGKRKKPRKKR